MRLVASRSDGRKKCFSKNERNHPKHNIISCVAGEAARVQVFRAERGAREME